MLTKTSRVIGGLLLIVGTSIGGGMLALPIANAAAGFWQSALTMFFCWFCMTIGALLILEANLYLPRGKHMVSMAYATLGNGGLLLTWLSYIFLLYALLSAYISGGGDVFNALLTGWGFKIKEWQACGLFTLTFGLIVYGGIYSVDYANRVLMFGKLAVYVILVLLITPHVQLKHFQGGNIQLIGGTLMILLTSFGFAVIVPNLRDYFDDDIQVLRKVIILGSLIPLVCYITWDAVIMGTIPSHGDNGLIALLENPRATSTLAELLSAQVSSPWISGLFSVFMSVCMLTAFLGVSLCLFSFLADGLKLRDTGTHGIGLFFLTFLPPLLIVIGYPGAYLHALRYAGILCVILLLLLPALMCIAGRKKFSSTYVVPGGILPPVFIILLSALLLFHEAIAFIK